MDIIGAGTCNMQLRICACQQNQNLATNSNLTGNEPVQMQVEGLQGCGSSGTAVCGQGLSALLEGPCLIVQGQTGQVLDTILEGSH